MEMEVRECGEMAHREDKLRCPQTNHQSKTPRNRRGRSDYTMDGHDTVGKCNAKRTHRRDHARHHIGRAPAGLQSNHRETDNWNKNQKCKKTQK